MLKLSCTIEILSQVNKKPSFSLTVPDWFEILSTVRLKLGFLINFDKIKKVNGNFLAF